MDWSDKVEAYNIDEACCRYNSQSTDVQFYPHSATFEERWGCETPPGLPVPPPGASVRHFRSWGGQRAAGPAQVPRALGDCPGWASQEEAGPSTGAGCV